MENRGSNIENCESVSAIPHAPSSILDLLSREVYG